MIRLGSLAGYSFEGPRVLAGWTAPARPAVYCIAYKPDDARDQFVIIYVGHADDLSKERLPFSHPHAPRWIKRAGSRYKLYIATLEAPGAMRSHREQIVKELCATYEPSCNDLQYDVAWRDEWIGEYTAPTTGPLTTGRDPVA